MLNRASVQAALPCTDYDRGRAFWGDQLGFEVDRDDAGGTSYKAGGGTSFFVFPSGGKASGDHTQIGFRVSDIEATVADLRSKGVTFEEYDMPDLKTENGIATLGAVKGAWFKDSEGNVIALIQDPD